MNWIILTVTFVAGLWIGASLATWALIGFTERRLNRMRCRMRRRMGELKAKYSGDER